jgi:hypothetical protein
MVRRLDQAAYGASDQYRLAVSYRPTHVGRPLRQLGWSLQEPVCRAAQHDEAAIAVRHYARWQALESARREGRIIVWVDESSFYLLADGVDIIRRENCLTVPPCLVSPIAQRNSPSP